MSDIAIRARDLTKVYRLYERSRHRLLDLVGLLPAGSSAYREHRALDGVSLDIARGEKVAVIGRNGAGKSTLLKLVCQVIQPTSGSIEVAGLTRALLQLGTGFHPDFTGRQNVYAYLAQTGVTGTEADRLFREVVEFSELEEYVDQPVKTYSTGMGVRLMFSTSTAVTPDLLVLDEVLSVGDAYFTQKSFDRIRELCLGKGTTLLLVTHDVYSASRLCDRMIWIDRGRVILDGACPDVLRAYEDSIRLQEETRLRLRKQERLRALAASEGEARSTHVLIELRAADGSFLPSPVHFGRIELCHDGVVVSALPLGAGAFDQAASHLERDGSSWGEPAAWLGRPARAFLDHGSPFRKVVGVFLVPGLLARDAPERFGVTLECGADEACTLAATGFVGNRQYPLGEVPVVAGSWQRRELAFHSGERAGLQAAPAFASAGVHGTGAITIQDVRLVDHRGDDVFVVQHGEAVDVDFRYRIHDERLHERAQVLMAFLRDGVQDVCRIGTQELLFDASAAPSGTVRLHLPKLLLANGRYGLTVMVARHGYYDQPQARYFSLSPEVYACLSQVVEFVVEGGGVVATGTGVVADGIWSIDCDDDRASVRAGAGAKE